MESMLLQWDVIQEILLRLPVKSLVRFKRVCKSWHSLISDPDFAKSHYQLSAAPSHKFLRIASSGYEALSIDVYASLLNVARLILPLLPPNPDEDVYICGFCRGFVLIESYPNFCIWNPSTGSYRELSCPEIWEEEHQFVKIRLTGFGYDPSTDDYLVVVLFDSAFGDDHDHMVKRLMLFSLRTNLWKEIQGSHLPDLDASPFQSFFCNDAVHWLAFSYESLGHVIIAFDLEKMNFYEISLPHLDVDHSFSYSNLGTMGECLCFCIQCDGDTKTQVWIMKEYKVQSSWTMLEIPTHLSDDVCIAKGHELIALRFNATELLKFNDKGELLERCMFDFGYHWVMRLGFGMYTESLLSLPRDYDGSMETPSTEIDQENRNV